MASSNSYKQFNNTNDWYYVQFAKDNHYVPNRVRMWPHLPKGVRSYVYKHMLKAHFLTLLNEYRNRLTLTELYMQASFPTYLMYMSIHVVLQKLYFTWTRRQPACSCLHTTELASVSGYWFSNIFDKCSLKQPQMMPFGYFQFWISHLVPIS